MCSIELSIQNNDIYEELPTLICNEDEENPCKSPQDCSNIIINQIEIDKTYKITIKVNEMDLSSIFYIVNKIRNF